MKKVAVIVAPGFEEGETLTIVDIIRRAHFQCDMFGFDKVVEGGHGICVQCDKILNDEVIHYDMVVLPGGYEGAANMRDSEEVISILHSMNEKGKYICAMCAAPIVLEKANLLVNRHYTAYKGYAFAYKLVDLLGGDSLAVKKRMVYFNAFDVKEDE